MSLAITLLGLSTLPLRVLGGLGGSSPLGVGGGSTPLLTGSTVPARGSGTGGTSEASSGSLPVTTSGVLEAGLDGGGTLLVSAGELLLLNLVLSLSLGVTVCELSVQIAGVSYRETYRSKDRP